VAAAAKPSSYRGTLVIENGPRRGIEQIVRAFPSEHRFNYLYVEQPNKSHSLNSALAMLDDGLAVMTDDDVRVDSQLLMAYDDAARHVEQGEYYGGPVLIDAEHGLPPAWQRRFYPYSIAEPWSLPHHAGPIPRTRTFMGTNWAAFVRDLAACGSFDTRLGPGGTTGASGQESEAQRRLAAGGVQPIYVPMAVVWHYLHRNFLEAPWMLGRTYRHALEWGIRRTRSRQPLAPILLRALTGRLNAHVKGAVFRLLGGEKRRFEAEFHEAKWRGRWDGIWLGRRWDELPQIKSPLRPIKLSRAA